MARSRNIKPRFFTNDEMAALPPLTRLLHIALWTLADREGRLEDRPKKIKAEALPYDDCEPDAMLQALHDAGFIQRYVSDGVKCIRVMNWHKHQNPHVKEQASTIPAPDITGASMVQATEEVKPHPEHAVLIPDSLNPLPDSGFPSKASEAVASVAVAEKTGDSTSAEESGKINGHAAESKFPNCPQQKILGLYREKLPTAVQHKQWDGEDAVALRNRWQETCKRLNHTEEEQGLKWFASLFEYIDSVDFLMGRIHDPGRRPFRVSLAWIVKKKYFKKLVDGVYT